MQSLTAYLNASYDVDTLHQPLLEAGHPNSIRLVLLNISTSSAVCTPSQHQNRC